MVSIGISLFLFTALSASLSLSRIGALDTQGNTYSEWWYTGTKPTLQGTADPGDMVTITVDDSSSEVTADDSGTWSFSTDLGEGEHSVTLVSGEESYSFTLHLGQSLPADLGSSGTTETTESTTQVPETGVTQLFALVAGVSALALGWYFYSTRKPYFDLD